MSEPPLAETNPASAALARELIGHFRAEYHAFLARYRTVDRPRPPMPEHVRQSSVEEQARWADTIDASLAREPRWGDLITRLFGDDEQASGRWEAALR